MAHQYELIQHDLGLAFRVFLVSIERRLFHWHSDLELLLVVEGSVAIDVGGQGFVLAQGDLFLINRNEIHSLSRTRDENLLLALQFDPAFCRSCEPRLQRARFLRRQPAAVGGASPLKDALLDLAWGFFARKEGYQVRTMGFLHEIAYQLLVEVPWEDAGEPSADKDSAATERLKRILSRIQAEFTEKITLRDIATAEDLDMSYLSHFLKEHLGISFQTYLGRLRLEKAVFLVTHTRQRLIDICLECGFSDYRYLYKAFRQEYGCSPEEYRRQCPPQKTTIPSETGEQYLSRNPGDALARLRTFQAWDEGARPDSHSAMARRKIEP